MIAAIAYFMNFRHRACSLCCNVTNSYINKVISYIQALLLIFQRERDLNSNLEAPVQLSPIYFNIIYISSLQYQEVSHHHTRSRFNMLRFLLRDLSKIKTGGSEYNVGVFCSRINYHNAMSSGSVKQID